jgi:hypothetical protein
MPQIPKYGAEDCCADLNGKVHDRRHQDRGHSACNLVHATPYAFAIEINKRPRQ